MRKLVRINRFRSYAELDKYFLKKYAIDRGIELFDTATLQCMQPSNMNRQQDADNTVAKPRKVPDVYEDETLNEVFIEAVDAPLSNTLSHYWTQNLHADLTAIVFEVESLLSAQNVTGNVLNRNQCKYNSSKSFSQKS